MNRRLVDDTIFLCLCVMFSGVALLWAGNEDSVQRKKLFDDYRAMEGEVVFFGKVVDQHGAPIEGASVKVSVPTPESWIKPIMTYRERTLITDRNGQFEVSKRTYAVSSLKGQYLDMGGIAKEGYECERIPHARNVFSFSTSDAARFVPDPANPIVYKMRKKGDITFLFQEMELDFEISADKSGQTKSFDFIKRHKIKDVKNPVFDGEPLCCDLLVKATFNTNDATWTMVLSPGNTNGGVIVSEQLLYETPADGYQPEYTFVPKDGRLQNMLYIYLKSRDPSIYSRYDIEYINAGKEFFRLSGKSVTNPYGDRNLEQVTDLPYEVTRQLTDEVKAAFRQNKRPEKPDLPKLIKEAKAKAEDEKKK